MIHHGQRCKGLLPVRTTGNEKIDRRTTQPLYGHDESQRPEETRQVAPSRYRLAVTGSRRQHGQNESHTVEHENDKIDEQRCIGTANDKAIGVQMDLLVSSHINLSGRSCILKRIAGDIYLGDIYIYMSFQPT